MGYLSSLCRCGSTPLPRPTSRTGGDKLVLQQPGPANDGVLVAGPLRGELASHPVRNPVTGPAPAGWSASGATGRHPQRRCLHGTRGSPPPLSAPLRGFTWALSTPSLGPS